MKRAEVAAAIDGLFAGLEIEEQQATEGDGSVAVMRVLSHPTLGPIGPELKSIMQGEAVREWFADGGDRAVIAYVVRQVFEEIKCIFCAANMEDDTYHLHAQCRPHFDEMQDEVDAAKAGES